MKNSKENIHFNIRAKRFREVTHRPFLQIQRKETGRSVPCWSSSLKTCESAQLFLQLLTPYASLGEHTHWGTNQGTAALQPETSNNCQ